MYCVKCGVKLENSEKECPLCQTRVYHPDIKIEEADLLFPPDKYPKQKPRSKALNGAFIVLFLIPLAISLIADWQTDGEISWFGYVAGALALGYVIFALPLWFRKPNPVIFVPCAFLAVGLYLLYISLVTGGGWFMSFAFPITGGMCLLCSAVVALLRYVKKGRLYIWGGAFLAFGGFMLLIEFLLDLTFGFSFKGWSIYPMSVFLLLGGALIYFAINTSAREMIERKLFF